MPRETDEKSDLDEHVAHQAGPSTSFVTEEAVDSKRLLKSLAEARRAGDLTQTAVGNRMGTSASVVARLESGVMNPTLLTLQRFAAAVGKKLRWRLTPAEPNLPRLVPGKEEAGVGVPLALENARAHIEASDLLADRENYGFAMAHLVFALEELEKARGLANIWLGELTDERTIIRLLADHDVRHRKSFAKSWSAGGVIISYLAQTVYEDIGLRPRKTSEERWKEAYEQHPEVLPQDWPDIASRWRMRGLYVDLLHDRQWQSPQKVTFDSYHQIRTATEIQFTNYHAAFEREMKGRKNAWIEEVVPDSLFAYRVEINDGKWRAWYANPRGDFEPIRFIHWLSDRDDIFINDDPMGLMELSHAILSDALKDSRTFDQFYRNASDQAVLRKFFLEKLVPIKEKGIRVRSYLERDDVRNWSRKNPFSRNSSTE